MPLIKYTQPSPKVHLLTLSSPPDNRLTHDLLRELGNHLDTIEARWRESGGGEMDKAKREQNEHKGAGAVVLTSECKGFFSNGLDYARSLKEPKFFQEIFDPVMYRLLTFPLVTVAAINGHGTFPSGYKLSVAFAGGFILAMACDFRIMTSGRGLMCMNEVTFSSPMPNSFVPLLLQRIPNPNDFRDTMLARRWTQKEGLTMGLLDEVVDEQNLQQRAHEVALREGVKCAPGSWGFIKVQSYREYILASQSDRPILFPHMEAKAFWKRYGDGDVNANL